MTNNHKGTIRPSRANILTMGPASIQNKRTGRTLILIQGVDIGHRGSAIRRQSVTEGCDRGEDAGGVESSEVPAEGVDCSCNRATGRNRAEERGGVDPNT